MGIRYNAPLDLVLEIVAGTFKVTRETYIKEFLIHPEWPSPKSVIDKYSELKDLNKK